MCYPPSSYILFSLRKLKFYGGWGQGNGGWEPDMRAGGWGPGAGGWITQAHLI